MHYYILSYIIQRIIYKGKSGGPELIIRMVWIQYYYIYVLSYIIQRIIYKGRTKSGSPELIIRIVWLQYYILSYIIVYYHILYRE